MKVKVVISEVLGQQCLLLNRHFDKFPQFLPIYDIFGRYIRF